MNLEQGMLNVEGPGGSKIKFVIPPDIGLSRVPLSFVASPNQKPMMTTTQTQLTQLLHKEMEQEARTTRKMLQRVPKDKYDWRPHPKSMTLLQLATHIAELPAWVSMTLHTDGLDFATSPYEPTPIANNGELLAFFERSLADGLADLARADDEDLLPTWTLRHGDQILSATSKGEMVRMSFSQIVHHRAQLGVYLRLLDIPIPGSYGPSADDPGF